MQKSSVVAFGYITLVCWFVSTPLLPSAWNLIIMAEQRKLSDIAKPELQG